MGNDYRQSAANYAQRPQNVGTDSLVFRTVGARLRDLRATGEALDIGCGAGRSTRFLQSFGLKTVGLDISVAMLEQARRADPENEYRCYAADTAFPLEDGRFNVILSTWAVLEVATLESLQQLFREASRVLKPGGTVLVGTNTPELYAHRWVSCDVEFPENAAPLRSGQKVTALLLPEGVRVHDYFWADSDYRKAFAAAGLTVKEAFYPTAPANEAGWCDETRVAPHVIYEAVRMEA